MGCFVWVVCLILLWMGVCVDLVWFGNLVAGCSGVVVLSTYGGLLC